MAVGVRGARFVAMVVAVVAMSSCSSSDGGVEAYPGALLWTDVNGQTQPPTKIVSHAGPEHCEWQSATFLNLGGGFAEGGKQYLRDPRRIVPGKLVVSFAADVELPADARDTGFRREGAALWTTLTAAYVVAVSGIERWPRTVDGIGCA